MSGHVCRDLNSTFRRFYKSPWKQEMKFSVENVKEWIHVMSKWRCKWRKRHDVKDEAKFVRKAKCLQIRREEPLHNEPPWNQHDKRLGVVPQTAGPCEFKSVFPPKTGMNQLFGGAPARLKSQQCIYNELLQTIRQKDEYSQTLPCAEGKHFWGFYFIFLKQ